HAYQPPTTSPLVWGRSTNVVSKRRRSAGGGYHLQEVRPPTRRLASLVDDLPHKGGGVKRRLLLTSLVGELDSKRSFYFFAARGLIGKCGPDGGGRLHGRTGVATGCLLNTSTFQ